MPDKLIGKENAVLAKEKGFNEPTLDHHERGIDGYGWGIFSSGEFLRNEELTPTYTPEDSKGFDIPMGQEGIFGEFSAPTQTCLTKWLREKHNIHVSAFPSFEPTSPIPKGYVGHLFWFEGYGSRSRDIPTDYSVNIGCVLSTSYEEALELALFQGLELIVISGK